MTAVPTMHQASSRGSERPRRSPDGRLRLLRSSSASLPPSVTDRARGAFEAPVLEAYGMTEAAHQIASNPSAAGAA